MDARELDAEYRERQRAVNDVLRLISAADFDLQTVFTAVIEAATRLCRAEHGLIYLLDGGVFRMAAGARRDGRPVPQVDPEPVDRGTAIGRAALTGGPVMIPDVLEDPEYALLDLQRKVGFRTLLAVPIKHDGEVTGAITTGRDAVEPFTDSEILLVTAFAEQATIALEIARHIQTIERQKADLSRFLAPQVAALISSAEAEQLLAGHRRQVAALFADLRGFSAFAETADPEELFALLREYHAAMGALIVDYGGTLEHFAGDGMMVFFNDPIEQPDHVERAVRLAVAMRTRFAELSIRWHRLGHDLGLGIGLAVGYATLGRIGFEGRYDYGAVGSVIIVASRLSTEASSGQILLSPRAHAAVEELVEVEPVGELQLKGISRPISAVNVLGIAREAAPT